jgi:SAM-dependent methyltransferase
MRKVNNDIKREFLNTWVPRGASVLDVGCGQGGDLHKWRAIGVTNLTGIDPNPFAIEEAKRRSRGYGTFKVGTILDIPFGSKFDVICYNFSIQYEDPKNYRYLATLLNPGGKLIGITPDKSRFEFASEDGIVLGKISNGEVSVWIPDTPYYANGAIVEPVLDCETFIKNMNDSNLNLVLFGESFSIYSKFVFLLGKD